VLRVTIMIAPIKGLVMAEPAGRPSDVQVRTCAEEDEYDVPTPGARAAELGAADPRLETAGQRLEAVGIEPKRSDTLTLRGHSVFSRIATKRTEPDLLLPYPAVPWNALACPALWSLFGH
jgi:hypothetical protein